jgi:hypothetical protein
MQVHAPRKPHRGGPRAQRRPARARQRGARRGQWYGRHQHGVPDTARPGQPRGGDRLPVRALTHGPRDRVFQVRGRSDLRRFVPSGQCGPCDEVGYEAGLPRDTCQSDPEAHGHRTLRGYRPPVRCSARGGQHVRFALSASSNGSGRCMSTWAGPWTPIRPGSFCAA